jgi:hypothetical protein
MFLIEAYSSGVPVLKAARRVPQALGIRFPQETNRQILDLSIQNQKTWATSFSGALAFLRLKFAVMHHTGV